MTLTRRNFLKASLLPAVGASFHVGKAASVERPNVLWIVNDASRAKNYSCYGYKRNTSPNVDQLAARGLLCERAYSQAFWTSPSVSSYMTGKYFPDWPSSWMLYGESVLMHPPKAEVLAPALFAQHGYETLLISCNTGMVSADTRLGRAFGQTVVPKGEGLGRFDATGKPLNKRFLKTVNDSLIPWLKRRTGLPFFIYVHTVETHTPYIIPTVAPFNQWIDEDYTGDAIGKDLHVSFSPEERRAVAQVDIKQLQGLYDGCIHYADHHLGALLDALDRMKMLDETVVVYSSDHGEQLFDDGMTHGHSDKNAGPDTTHHIPLVIAGPGVPQGRRMAQPAQSIDILPTLAALCGIPIVGEIDGHDLLRARDDSHEGGTPSPRYSVTRQGDPLANKLQALFVCTKDHKLEWRQDKADQHLWRLPLSESHEEDDVADSASLANLRRVVENPVLPIMQKACVNQIPRAYLFRFDNSFFLARIRKHSSPIVNSDSLTDSGGEAPTGTWVLHDKGGGAFLTCAPSTEERPKLEFSVPMTAGKYKILVECSLPAREELGSCTPIATLRLGVEAAIDIIPDEAPEQPGWTFLSAGPVSISRGYRTFTLRPGSCGATIRALLLHPDTPGALEHAQRMLLGEEAHDRSELRQEELEALGYI